MATLQEIRVAIEQRLEVVRAAKDEYDRLVAALEALGGSPEPTRPPRRRRRVKAVEDAEAPYGYKKDGTPRKRPGRKAEPVPAAAEVRRAKAEGGAVLHITTGGVPPVRADAEPAYVTQEG